MPGFTRIKRVTDPWDEKVMDRIVGLDRIGTGYVSSGSEHSAEAGDDDVFSPSLSDLFYGFDVADAGDSFPELNDSGSERYPSMCDSNELNLDSVKHILQGNKDAFAARTSALVSKALEIFSSLKSDKQIIERSVMSFLRDRGYNAAICKTKWEKCGGITAGNYEFIDVVRSDAQRYFIDLDFASEFIIARPNNFYASLLQYLPRVYVGKSEDLKQILKVMSDAAKRSMMSKGLHLPPWRKHRFIQNKWLGPYRRTISLFPASFSSGPPVMVRGSADNRRTIGFDAAAEDGCSLRRPARNDIDV